MEETLRWGIWEVAFLRFRWRTPCFWNGLSLVSSAVGHTPRVGTFTVSRWKGSPVNNAWVSLMGVSVSLVKGALERTTKCKTKHGPFDCSSFIQFLAHSRLCVVKDSSALKGILGGTRINRNLGWHVAQQCNACLGYTMPWVSPSPL